MTWPPRWSEPHFKHTSVVPTKLERGWKKAAKQTALDKCYAKVDERDCMRCRLTGYELFAGHRDPKFRLTRDHLGARSTHPEGRADVDNVLTVSAWVHDYMQLSALYPVNKAGDETTKVSTIVGWRWRESMFREGKPKPFRLPKDRK